jgi:hypothetical protein
LRGRYAGIKPVSDLLALAAAASRAIVAARGHVEFQQRVSAGDVSEKGLILSRAVILTDTRIPSQNE